MELIEWVGLILGITGFILITSLAWMIKKYHRIKPSIKIMSLFAIFIAPLLSLVVANYHVFETSKEVKSCMGCHVMLPMGIDMLDSNSTSLAARHYRNNWINKQECYSCHKDYGLNGTFKAKADGYRHLLTYVTHTYKEPIKYRGEFNINNCLQCHEGTSVFMKVEEHEPVIENIKKGAQNVSCLNCHGLAHPSSLRRTPSHPDYKMLTSPFSMTIKTKPENEIRDLKFFLTHLILNEKPKN